MGRRSDSGRVGDVSGRKQTSGASVWMLADGTEGARGSCTNGVVLGEEEGEAEDLVCVDGVGIEDADVHLPFSEVVGFDQLDSWGKFLFGLLSVLEVASGKWDLRD